jgi:hypothetical protein
MTAFDAGSAILILFALPPSIQAPAAPVGTVVPGLSERAGPLAMAPILSERRHAAMAHLPA